ncbi:MAG: laccase domain-containing protein [Alphaproteobacteria bacterium]
MVEQPPSAPPTRFRPRRPHGFFGREGGASSGIYASLNCGLGSGDVRENALENRRRAMAALGASALNTAYQVHSATALVVTGAWPAGQPLRADAMVTRTPGLALGVLAADCAGSFC